ncbi:MAG: RNA polymerase Rpb4 [Desulfurococcaceae archaeon]
MSSIIKLRVEKEELISNSEAYYYLKNAIEKIREETGSVPLIMSRVLEYLKEFSKIPFEDVEKVKKYLVSKGLKAETIVMIINICPMDIDELRSLMEFEEKVYEESVLNEIVNYLKNYCVSGEKHENV